MKRLLLLLLLSVPSFAACTITVFVSGTVAQAAPMNANFASLNLCKPQVFSGTTLPGNISGSKLGDLYLNTATGLSYQCFKTSGVCTSVAAANWVQIGGGGGGTGNVTAASTLASAAIMTGAGTTAAQTPAVTATLDGSGNFSTPGGASFGVGTSTPAGITLFPGLVGALPVCNSGAEGQRRSVTDATATTFFSVVVGGGANHVPITCDGTNWRIG